MTERARMWRWMDLLALAGLLILLVGLPVSGGVDDGGPTYASATSFDVPWPRVGDHIVYDLIVDDENGVHNYPAIMEVERRMAEPGEVPVDAPYVEERVFRPIFVEEGNLLLDSRGWMDRTYHLASGERVYVVAEGIHPHFEEQRDYRNVTEWIDIQWEGQVAPGAANAPHWSWLGRDIRHIPDDRSMTSALLEMVFDRPDPNQRVSTSVEASYHGGRLFGVGMPSEITLDRLGRELFTGDFEDPCVAEEFSGLHRPFHRLPMVAYWDAERADCSATSGYWFSKEHAGMAGSHERLEWSDGTHVTLDLVPRLLARGAGAEYRPGSYDMPADPATARPERIHSPPEQVSVLDIDSDVRPVVRDLSLALLRQALLTSGPACVVDFLLDGGRIASFSWTMGHVRFLPQFPAQPPVTVPVLPTGHAPADEASVYESSWGLGLLAEDGETVTVETKVKETYPGPSIEFAEWKETDGEVCATGGTVEDPDTPVVPPVALAGAAHDAVVRHWELPPGERDTALSWFSFEPAFEWTDEDEAKGPIGPPASPGRAYPLGALDVWLPAGPADIGIVRYGHRPALDSQLVPIAGMFSAHDGGIVHEVKWTDATQEGPSTTNVETAATTIDVVPPAPAARDVGLAMLLSWLVLRLLVAIRVGAHFPLVAWLYAKVRDADVLMHERRAAIMELLRADPGLTVTDVSKRMGLAWGATVHHLDRLKQAGLVRAVRDGRSRRFVVKQEGVSDAEALARGPERARLIEALEKEPGLTAAELAKRLSRDRTSVARMAARLVEAEALERRRDGRKVRFYVQAKR